MDETRGYFKVDERMCNLQSRAISEQGLKVYLLHCMRLNPKQHLNCSLSGFKDANKLTGVVDTKLYQKVMDELVGKHLVKLRPDVNTGWLKSPAVEVLSFPKYDAKNKRFSKDAAKAHEHRTYKESKYLQIPSVIVEEGHLRMLNAEDVLNLLMLYQLDDYERFHGIDFREIHCYSSKNPLGYTPFKTDKYLSEVDPSDKYQNKNMKLNCPAINHLVSRGLIIYQPALIYRDPVDADNTYILKMLKESDSGKFVLGTPSVNQVVIHILQPRYKVEELLAKTESSITT
jgi:hypothetical protein